MQRWLPVILIGLGTFFLIASAIFAWVLFPIMYVKGISKKVNLDPNGETFEKWRNITSPITISYYIYNITNPIEDLLKGATPVLDEIGPYVYREKRLKHILGHNDEEDTVKYRQSITYVFEPELSNGTLDDIVTVPSIPFIGIAKRIVTGEISTAAGSFMNEEILKRKIKPYVTVTVDELLFKGYKPDIILVASELQGGIDILPNNTFSLNMNKNGIPQGELEVHRGIRSSDEFGKIVTYQNETQLSFWQPNSTCNEILGTDGSIFAPFVTTDRTIYLFSDDLCRSLYLTYEKDVEHHGLTGYRFSLPERLLQRASENPDNLCYCANPDEPETCKAGMIELAGCKKGIPLVATTPHFLYGEKSDAEAVDLVPDVEKHITFIDIEPTTGVMLQATKRIQLNIKIEPTKRVYGCKKLKPLLHPIMWADERAALSADKAELLKAALFGPIEKVNMAKWVAMGLSCLLIAIGLIVLVVRMRQKKYRV